MEILNGSDASFMVDDELLKLLDVEGDEKADPDTVFDFKAHFPPSSAHATTTINSTDSETASLPEFVEEELEWLLNEDAFPSVETCFGILSDNPELMLNHQSPVSVLESSSNSNTNSKGNGNGNSSTIASCCHIFKLPTYSVVRARSKRSRRTSGFGVFQLNVKNKKRESGPMMKTGAGMGRRCLHCQADKTPQWRAGPMGPKTLCNACGVRYKSGRLLPEYRPASSPTFSTRLHSNSHRKVVEMRRQKQLAQGEIIVNESLWI